MCSSPWRLLVDKPVRLHPIELDWWRQSRRVWWIVDFAFQNTSPKAVCCPTYWDSPLPWCLDRSEPWRLSGTQCLHSPWAFPDPYLTRRYLPLKYRRLWILSFVDAPGEFHECDRTPEKYICPLNFVNNLPCLNFNESFTGFWMSSWYLSLLLSPRFDRNRT